MNERLDTIIRKAFRTVTHKANEQRLPLRIAAFELGIERVLEASRTRGYITTNA